MAELQLAPSEFVLGGQKSGKSRRAELLARAWLAGGAGHEACLLATAQPWDAEMAQRIARHQSDRAARVPGLRTLEVPLDLPQAIRANSQPQRLLVVDCLTLWLTNLMMPAHGTPLGVEVLQRQMDDLLCSVKDAPGPVVLVGNEIGLGVIPMGREVRDFVDNLGRLNQGVADMCERVTLMVAGQPLNVKPAGDLL